MPRAYTTSRFQKHPLHKEHKRSTFSFNFKEIEAAVYIQFERNQEIKRDILLIKSTFENKMHNRLSVNFSITGSECNSFISNKKGSLK